MNGITLIDTNFIRLYRQSLVVMSEAQTTKTVVVANDIHKAIRVFAEEHDRPIQDVVDDLLRGDGELQSDVMTTYTRLEKAGNLPTTT